MPVACIGHRWVYLRVGGRAKNSGRHADRYRFHKFRRIGFSCLVRPSWSYTGMDGQGAADAT